VISIKKYLDSDASQAGAPPVASPEDLLEMMQQSYRATLAAIATCGAQACPALGSELQQSLRAPAEQMRKKVTPVALKETEEAIEKTLADWGVQTAEYFRQRASDVKEILMVLARAAESVSERDQRHANQFTDFTKRLQGMANLEDLPKIRAALVRGAKDLQSCVDTMEQDSRDSVAALRTQVTTYQAKLEEAEQRASRDALTGLDNRHGVETKTERRIAEKRPFCIVMLDLNGFKQVNDTYGHLAGDDLLKQFSAELRSASRSTDVVGRWGGDEFVLVLDCNLADAQHHLERMQKWVFGEYTVQVGADGPKVSLGAALGVVEWKPPETLNEVLKRADAAMYQQKAAAHRTASTKEGQLKQ